MTAWVPWAFHQYAVFYFSHPEDDDVLTVAENSVYLSLTRTLNFVILFSDISESIAVVLDWSTVGEHIPEFRRGVVEGREARKRSKACVSTHTFRHTLC